MYISWLRWAKGPGNRGKLLQFFGKILEKCLISWKSWNLCNIIYLELHKVKCQHVSFNSWNKIIFKCSTVLIIWDAVRDLVPFAQFKKWKTPMEECYLKWSCFIKSNTPSYQIAQSITVWECLSGVVKIVFYKFKVILMLTF